ncbi:hypothetical protein K488DRAFT_92386 [Vararia minispora EC-137]|uniref:Uncharacterized protein n=1 Tax=Vararia minispora EC-137 TaxID=1314806 RepID=A0ACB8Q470_9AGAM|nr:hypothetical protein K488DRAFT_92386 [Vararia minispora EC-137]
MHFPDDTQLEKRFLLGDSIRSMYAFVHSTVLDNVKPIMLVICASTLISRSHPSDPCIHRLTIEEWCALKSGAWNSRATSKNRPCPHLALQLCLLDNILGRSHSSSPSFTVCPSAFRRTNSHSSPPSPTDISRPISI